MTTEIKTPTERKVADCERRFKHLKTCEKCGKADDCCDGLCEACRRFYLDECENEFGL